MKKITKPEIAEHGSHRKLEADCRICKVLATCRN